MLVPVSAYVAVVVAVTVAVTVAVEVLVLLSVVVAVTAPADCQLTAVCSTPKFCACRDALWADGTDGSGRNWLGKLLMERYSHA